MQRYTRFIALNNILPSLTLRRAMSTPSARARPRDFDSSYSDIVRKYKHIYGLLPPAVEDTETQLSRCLHRLHGIKSDIDKHLYLSSIRNSDEHLFYRLITRHIKQIAPLIYTPTVGDACLQWSQNYVQPEGLYLTWADRGRIASVLQDWPEDEVKITVVTDGSRILGLGDLGVNGMGIPIGKLALYTACAGIRPETTLPLMLDLGTGNEQLINDPLYLGRKEPRVTADEEMAYLDELMRALTEKWPGIVIQFEDFKDPFPALTRFREDYVCFNDDIQGTGAVILGGMISAISQSGIHARDHRAVFLGAGSAGVGVAKQIVDYFVREGLTEKEARENFWLVDSKGLITTDRGDILAPHKTYFARHDNDGRQFKTLEKTIDFVKPTILMGLSTIGGAFLPQVLRKMADWNAHPIIFPLSNPSRNSECTFASALENTNGTALFASGSPFEPIYYRGKLHSPGQGNNMYVFPGIGLGTILCKATKVTNSMIYASAIAVSKSLTASEQEQGFLYPDVARIREVSVNVALSVIRAAEMEGVSRETHLTKLNDAELKTWVQSKMYDPFLETRHVESEVGAILDAADPALQRPAVQRPSRL